MKKPIRSMTLTEAESLRTTLVKRAEKFGADQHRTEQLRDLADHIDRLKRHKPAKVAKAAKSDSGGGSSASA